MPICYGNSGGVGRFIKRVEQPLYVDYRTDEAKAEAADEAMVLCVETNRVYRSLADAARGMQMIGTAMVTLSATVSAIRRACERGEATACGFHWTRVELEGK